MDSYIKIDGLKKSFSENDVLRGVTLEMKKNESLVVIGRSGCGKSVLLKHLNGLIEPDAGAVFFEGRNISELKSKELVELRKNMGMLFQSAALLDSLTVGENVGLGLRESRLYVESDIKDIVEEKLKLVGFMWQAVALLMLQREAVRTFPLEIGTGFTLGLDGPHCVGFSTHLTGATAMLEEGRSAATMNRVEGITSLDG